MSLTLAGATLITGLAGAGISGASLIGSGKRKVKRQKELMDYQDKINDANYTKELQDQRQLIAEDREYNSIGAQMQRAREAGVSPLAALGVASGNSVSASAPSTGSVGIPSEPSDPISSAGNIIGSSITGVTDHLIKTETLKQAKVETFISEKTAELKIQSAEFATRGLELTNQKLSGEIQLQPYQQRFFDEQAKYFAALTDRTKKLTPHEIEKFMNESMLSALDYLKKEQDIDIAQKTLAPILMDMWASAYSKLASASLQNMQAKYVGYNAQTQRMFVNEQGRHNLASEGLTQQQILDLKEFRNLSIELEQGKLDFAKTQRWIELGTKIVCAGVGAGVGFFIGGPAGAAVGAGLGLGIDFGSNPFATTNSRPKVGF